MRRILEGPVRGAGLLEEAEASAATCRADGPTVGAAMDISVGATEAGRIDGMVDGVMAVGGLVEVLLGVTLRYSSSAEL